MSLYVWYTGSLESGNTRKIVKDMLIQNESNSNIIKAQEDPGN